jgi:PAS domain S-box-containing protein
MENELSRVVDALPGVVWTALPAGHIGFLNQRWCEYTGLNLDEAYGRGWQIAIQPEDLCELLERCYARCIGATTTQIKASHVPFLSHPKAVARVIEAAARGSTVRTAQ